MPNWLKDLWAWIVKIFTAPSPDSPTPNGGGGVDSGDVETFKIVNESSYTLPDGWLVAADDALQQGLRHTAAAWTDYVWHITAALKSQGLQIRLVDTLPEAEGALAYHDNDADGPFIRVGLKVIFDNGGDWFVGDLSVISVIDHETKETVGDPACNLWANDAGGTNWARELCDYVEADVYTVTTKDGVACTLSNFVYPAFFNPFATGDDELDHMVLCTAPFEIRPGGYGIREDGGNVTQVFSAMPGPRPDGLRHRAVDRASYGQRPVLMVTEDGPPPNVGDEPVPTDAPPEVIYAPPLDAKPPAGFDDTIGTG